MATDTVYVLVPVEVTVTNGGTHQYTHRNPSISEIEDQIRAGYCYKQRQTAMNYLDRDNPDQLLRFRFPDAGVFLNKFPDCKCKACNKKLGGGTIRWSKGYGAMHNDCWLTK